MNREDCFNPEFEMMSRPEIEKLQLERLQKTVKHCMNSPFYKKRFDEIGLKPEECNVTEDGLEAIIDTYKSTSGIRDLEQAAEHIAANALYRIEVEKVPTVTYDAKAVKALM